MPESRAVSPNADAGPSTPVSDDQPNAPKSMTIDPPPGQPVLDPRSKRAALLRKLLRWAVRLAVVVVTVVVLWRLFLVAVNIATTEMWFNSVHHGAVYTTMIEAKVLLFCVFAVIGGLVGGFTLFAVRRLRSPLAFAKRQDAFRWVFRKHEGRLRRYLMILAVVVPAILIGQRAASGWQTYLLWRHAVPWHVSDPLFHKDVSFFVEVYPFHVLVVALLSQAVTYGLWIAAITGYWYGGWRIRRGRRKITRDFTRLLSVLFAAYLVLKGASYWLSRYALTTSSRGPVTGPSYTDVHAILPGRYVLTAIAILGAVALLVSAFTSSRARVIAGALVLLVIAAGIAGYAWPALLQHFREAPSAAKLDLGEIRDNEQATLAAFGLDGDITTVDYNPTTTVHGKALVQLANQTAQIPVIDPNQLSPTFNVEQQLQAYYGFKSTLDIARYPIDGRSQDVALAVRELQSGGIPKPTWGNTHLVYTHGYGIVAAPTTKVDAGTESPVFLDGGMPPGQQIPVKRPQVYFGQSLGSSYAIVGQPAGSKEKIEFDHPGGNGSSVASRTTYRGHGGIPIGSTLRKFLFAVQLSDPNIFFSSGVNSGSQLLMIRSPRARIAQVAPWLTLDGNIYPAVVNGEIKWIADAYTTTDNYPNSQSINLHSASSTTLSAHGASVGQPNTQVNYLRNSVKAVVDAYTGKVSLYEWDQARHPDPLLKAWEGVYPGLVQPQSSISPALLSQLRYPSDLFNVQRFLLTKYHVTQPENFYSGNDFWTVPNDPTVAAAQAINSSSGKRGSPPSSLPSRYISMSADGYGAQHFSLSSPMVTLNGRQLSAFVYVNSQPGPDYGKFTVLQFPSGEGGESPLQVQNDIESDTKITEVLTLERGGNSKVVLGGLEAIPVAGRILYVEPVYTQSTGGVSFPILRHVIALYANGNPSFESDLATAVKNAILSSPGSG